VKSESRVSGFIKLTFSKKRNRLLQLQAGEFVLQIAEGPTQVAAFRITPFGRDSLIENAIRWQQARIRNARDITAACLVGRFFSRKGM